jgi:hypothetical protein
MTSDVIEMNGILETVGHGQTLRCQPGRSCDSEE